MRGDRVCVWHLTPHVAKQLHRSLQRHGLHSWYFDSPHGLLHLKSKNPTRGILDGVPSVRKISELRDPVPALILPSGPLCDLRGAPNPLWNVTSSSVK